MCEANAYLVKDGEERLVMEAVDLIEPLGEDGWLLVGIFGDQVSLKARMKSMNLVNHKILFEEREHALNGQEHAHEHSHEHTHQHEHEHEHDGVKHSHPHGHTHIHGHEHVHSHDGDAGHEHKGETHDPHEHGHSGHEKEPHDHKH